MATDINKILIIGRATKDPELKYTQGGTAVASLSLANNKSWTQNGEKKEQVSFFNVIAWAKLGETIAQYVKKGDRIAIEGRLQQRSWQDKDGGKRSTVEIIAENVQFLGVRQDGAKSEGTKTDGGLGLEEVPADSVKGFDQQAPSHFSDEDISF